jgi:hypothetical protein
LKPSAGLTNSRLVCGFADTLSAAPSTYHMSRDDSGFVVFCFARPEDAETFCDRFAGKAWRSSARGG